MSGILHRRILLLLASLLLTVSQVAARTAPAPSTPEQQFKDLQREAREQMERFKKGAVAADPRPDLAARFWTLREKSAGGTVAGDAARESLRLLVEAGRADEALAKLHDLPASDPAWRAGALSILRDVAVSKNDRGIFLSRVGGLLAGSTDATFRARIHYSAARFHQAGSRWLEATAAFEAAVAENAESEFGKRSARELYDMRELNVGQAAPAFSAATVFGKQVSAAGLRGHTTVFVYWASW